jgi:predicted transcriptional regulator of viral defense system
MPKKRSPLTPKSRDLITARKVAEFGYHTQVLSRMVRERALERVARGTYRTPHHTESEHHSLAIVASVAPKTVICLLSALAFHEIGTQLPREVWVAIDRSARRPFLYFPPLRVARFGGEALTSGIESHVIEGQTVRVYNAAKTVADCFKYRNKIGLDIALEALRDGWQRRLFTMKDIERFAAICRVSNVMRPYLEALSA